MKSGNAIKFQTIFVIAICRSANYKRAFLPQLRLMTIQYKLRFMNRNPYFLIP